MNRVTRIRQQLLQLTVLIVASSYAEAQTLAVVLEPLGAQSIDEPIEMAIRFENRGNSSVVVFPVLNTVSSSDWPDSVVKLSILDAEGKAVPFLGRDSNAELKRKFPDPCDFREVPPGAFFGYRLVLSEGPFAFGFTSAGVYRVSAEVEFKTAELLPLWMERWSDPEWKSTCESIRADILKQQDSLYARGIGVAEAVELVIK